MQGVCQLCQASPGCWLVPGAAPVLVLSREMCCSQAAAAPDSWGTADPGYAEAVLRVYPSS